MDKLVPWPESLESEEQIEEFAGALGMLAGALTTVPELQEWLEE